MKGNIGKGTDIFRFFSDYFKLVGEFYIVESNESYWDGLMAQSEALIEQYKNCDFYEFVKAMVLVYNVWLSDVKYGQKKGGHWTISYKKE